MSHLALIRVAAQPVTEPEDDKAMSQPPHLYLGPAIQRWRPSTPADIQNAIDNGALEERHWLDIKRQLNHDKHDKIELARDAASFANDGGVLLIGVDEDRPTGKLTLAPTRLSGLAETVEQILHQRCDPPLFVQCHPIPVSPEDMENGYLVIEIPPSPLAPHMVDGQYHGRGDKTKHRLNDAAVERLFAIRAARQVTAEQLIAAEIARDPIEDDRDQDVRLYAVAHPIASPPELLTPHLVGDELQSLVTRAAMTPHTGSWLQSLHQYNQPRAAGRGWHTYDLHSRILSPNAVGKNRPQADLEISDNGSIALFASALVGATAIGFARDVRQRYVYTAEAVGLVRALVTLAGEVGTTFGYRGQWEIAVGLTNLNGLVHNSTPSLGEPDQLLRYSASRYVQGTSAGTGELQEAPGPVVSRLMYKFVRALGAEQFFADVFARDGKDRQPT
ncbi:helix-turn-helix domain-containing protein [Amycolatopsis sp. MJM2582]|uniref:AlbA family DNA-binding domain-containing protein n=1 Tax=Amycolatopsis sp. MJM2582 TaxID=1427749 RepID=UPI00126A3CA1|nr:ATP-binding protein [Amycolatopsis sp. MJM2582]